MMVHARDSAGASFETMLSHEPYGAGLRSLGTVFFKIGHSLSRLELIECIGKHTVSMKINLVAIGGLDEAELARGVDVGDRAYRLRLMVLGFTLQLPHLILKLASRPLERVIDSEMDVCVALVPRVEVIDGDHFAIG